MLMFVPKVTELRTRNVYFNKEVRLLIFGSLKRDWEDAIYDDSLHQFYNEVKPWVNTTNDMHEIGAVIKYME